VRGLSTSETVDVDKSAALPASSGRPDGVGVQLSGQLVLGDPEPSEHAADGDERLVDGVHSLVNSTSGR
jgi:hypothetical protein